MIEILRANLRIAEDEGDHRAAERIRRSIEFLMSRANAQNDNFSCPVEKPAPK